VDLEDPDRPVPLDVRAPQLAPHPGLRSLAFKRTVVRIRAGV
jgi:hypothetical protein